MKKTLMHQSVLGNVYAWGSDKYGYTMYLEKPQDRVIHVSAEMRKSAHAYLASTPMYRGKRAWDVLEKMMAMGVYGQFKIVTRADKSFTLEHKRYVPVEVRKAYAERMNAQRSRDNAVAFLLSAAV